jgi:hypothetical protein
VAAAAAAKKAAEDDLDDDDDDDDDAPPRTIAAKRPGVATVVETAEAKADREAKERVRAREEKDKKDREERIRKAQSVAKGGTPYVVGVLKELRDIVTLPSFLPPFFLILYMPCANILSCIMTL